MNDKLIVVNNIQNILIAVATGESKDDSGYQEIRWRLLQIKEIEKLLPSFVKECSSIPQFWGFIKYKYSSYRERREFIWQEFKPLIAFLEASVDTFATTEISKKIDDLSMDYIKEYWDKSIERKKLDPEGAITASRSLVETVCKHILDKKSIEYDSKIDLPELYKKTAKQLKLSPEDHQEEVFKQILSGCISIVNGMGSLRNQIGDAHGKSIKYIKPSERHATLVVNISGAMSLFLMETFTNKKSG